ESLLHGTSSGTPRSRASFSSRGQKIARHERAQGSIAPWRRVSDGSGTMRSDVNVSTLPNPRQVGHTPSGLVNENSAGSGRIAAAPQFEHSQRSLLFSATR